ncbi:hypothetical protein D3C87_2118110 [compost metagenome]
MIIKELARLVCLPIFFTPRAKMVGNMMDIKKNTPISATTEIPSILSTTTPHSRILISE